MDLEERVERLEEDVSILKNQIRNTLLDIQDQMASLRPLGGRADDGYGVRRPASHPQDPGQEASMAWPSSSQNRRAPALKKVSLSQTSDQATESPDGKLDDADSPEGNVPSLETYAALVRWADTSVARIGRARTRTILETYAAEGRVTAHMKDSIVELALLGAADEAKLSVDTTDVLAAITALNRALGDASDAQPLAAPGGPGESYGG